MVCRSGPEIDIKETLGLYELSLVHRSMFAADGSMLKRSAKSALMAIFEKLSCRSSNQRNGDSTTTDVTGLGFKVNIINVMAELPGQTRLGEELCPNSGSFHQRNRTNERKVGRGSRDFR